MQRRQLLGGTALVVASSLFIVANAMAQTAPSAALPTAGGSASSSDQLGEVVVTARARAEKLLDVPISVQSFSAAQLKLDNIDNLDSLQYEAGFTFNSQNVTYTGGGREQPSLIFRGMTSNLQSGFANTGALFVDGIFISSGEASVTMADVSQVEVLKGPQNVYFGKNTFGGAINLITANPTEEYHANATVGYSDLGSYDDVFSAEGAIVPGLLTARVTGELFHQGEQYKSIQGGPLGEEDTKGITLTLYATPTPDIWLKSRIHYSVDNDSTSAQAFISGATYGEPCSLLYNNYFCKGNIPSLASGLNPQSVLEGTAIPQGLLQAVISGNYPGTPGVPAYLHGKVPTKDDPGLIRDNLNASLEGGAKLPFGATFQFSAGYNQSASDDVVNADVTPIAPPADAFEASIPMVARDFEADARILTDSSKPLRFIAGVNYFRSVYQVAQDSDFDGFIYDESTGTNESDETEAVYASAEYDITSYLTATAEVRYQRDTVRDEPYEISYNHALPRFIVKYHPTKDTNLYVSYSEGVQPPQLQGSYATGDSYEKAFISSLGGGAFSPDPKIRVWEVGLKQSLFNNRVFFSVDYYNQFWDNALAQNFLFNAPGCSETSTEGTSTACPLPSSGASIINANEEHIDGVEFEGTAKITPKWTAHTAFDWTHAIYKSYNDQSLNGGPGVGAFASGTAPVQNGKTADLVPAFQGEWDTTYKDHLVADYNWYIRGVLTYTGSQYADPYDIAKISGYFHVNSYLGFTKDNLELKLYVTNLLNDKNWVVADFFPDPTYGFSQYHQGVIATAPNPRDFGFTISDKF
jgi:iron complex outermembrane receptor protein